MNDSFSFAIYAVGIFLALYSNLYTWRTQYYYIKKHDKAEKNLFAINYANAFLLVTFFLKLASVFFTNNASLQTAADISLFGSVLFLVLLSYHLKNTLYKNLKASLL